MDATTRTIQGGGEMKAKEYERIENAIRHIQTANDVDPWAMEIAIDAMKRQLPQAPMRSVDVYNHNLISLYCPKCGTWVGMSNNRLKQYDMHNNTNPEICGKCGQVFNLDGMFEDDKGVE